MANNAFANVKGSVFRIEHREGIAKKTGKPYSMDILHVLVEDAGVTELALPDSLSAALYGAGQEVDFSVEISRSEFGFRLSIIKDNYLAAIASRAS